MTYNFYINTKKNRFNECPIYLYIREKSNAIVLHTGEYISPELWDTKKQCAKRSYSGALELNIFLASYKESVRKFIRQLRADNPLISFDAIREQVELKYKSKNKFFDFFDAFETFIDVRRNEISTAMVKKYNTLLNLLKEFQQHTKYQLNFNSINLLFYDLFTNFLIEVKKHTNNTISKSFDLLKTFMRWATERKVNTNLEFMKFKTRAEKTDIVYLTADELMKIYRMDFSARKNLEKTRDVFCFACFTGARFSDVVNLKREDIKGDFWYLRVKKTRDILKIPLNKFAKEILNKYKHETSPLPILSNQKINKYLKEICKIAEIDDKITIVRYRGAQAIENVFPKYELITTHTARRTFVTLSLEKGMRPEVVMEITGHKDYKTFKKYIRITSNAKLIEINKVWNSETSMN